MIRPQRIILNARGIRYDIKLDTLDRLPNSRLGQLKSCIESSNFIGINTLCDDYVLNDKFEFYFNRDPFILNSILNCFSSGKLHIDDSICSMLIQDELKYWIIDDSRINNCCEWNFNDRRDNVLRDIKREKQLLKSHFEQAKFDNFYLPNLREKLWYLLEKPSSSIPARLIFVFSLLLILLSASLPIIRTLPDLREDSSDFVQVEEENKFSTKENEEKIKYKQKINFIFDKVQLACNIWFIFELLIRFFSSPSFIKFIKSPLNILDFLVTIISFCYYFIEGFNKTVLNVFKILRIIQIIKLFRFSTSLKLMTYVFRKSFKLVAVLLIYIMILVIGFSSFIYLAEQLGDKNTSYVSIPDSFWWAIITITTVGYGDLVPKTYFGKVIASICAIFGSLFFALPVGMITGVFTRYYENEKRKKKILNKYKRLNLIGDLKKEHSF